MLSANSPIYHRIGGFELSLYSLPYHCKTFPTSHSGVFYALIAQLVRAVVIVAARVAGSSPAKRTSFNVVKNKAARYDCLPLCHQNHGWQAFALAQIVYKKINPRLSTWVYLLKMSYA